MLVHQHQRIRGGLQKGPEPCFALAQRLLAPPPAGDIGVEFQDPRRVSSRAPAQCPTAAHDHAAAVTAHVLELAFPASLRQHLRLDLRQRAGISGAKKLPRRGAEGFRLGPAIEPLRPAVPVAHGPGEVADEDGVGGQIQQFRLFPDTVQIAFCWLRHTPSGPLFPNRRQGPHGAPPMI